MTIAGKVTLFRLHASEKSNPPWNVFLTTFNVSAKIINQARILGKASNGIRGNCELLKRHFILKLKLPAIFVKCYPRHIYGLHCPPWHSKVLKNAKYTITAFMQVTMSKTFRCQVTAVFYPLWCLKEVKHLNG